MPLYYGEHFDSERVGGRLVHVDCDKCGYPYGNADCKGKGSKYPHPELPFGSISALAVWKDKLFVMDVLNRRLVKCNISYDPARKSAK